jgi:hypothetical protein
MSGPHSIEDLAADDLGAACLAARDEIRDEFAWARIDAGRWDLPLYTAESPL